MPNLGPTTLGKIRKNRHALRGWLSIFTGTTIVSANVSATPATYPVSTLSMTITSGSSANIQRGAEIIVTTSAGLYKGRLRVRMSGTISSTSLPVAEVSQASVTIVSGDKLKILDEHRIRPKFPAADETFAPDLLTYSDQNSAVPPLALSGGPVCAWVDAGQTYATINFDGTGSYAVDPDGGSITHSWSFPGGGVSTSATPTGVQITAGQHWVKHTVTAGGKSWTQYIPVWVHNAANPPHEVLVESLSGSLQEGWSATFNMFDSLGQTEAPDGALVVFWVEEIIDGAVQSFGSKGRSASKFVGWLRSDEASSNAAEKRLTLTAISSLARLAEIYGSSKAMTDTVSPAAWSEIKELSVKLAIVQILRWYTTLTEVCDLAFDFTDYTYPSFPLQKTTPPEMLRELADAVDSRVACDRNGRIEVQLRPELTARTSRGSITTTTTIAEEDVIDLTVRREHSTVVDLLECRGITQTGAPFFSRYPGIAPGTGATNTVNDRLIVLSQGDINTRCGLRGAWLDRVYIDTSGVKNQSPQVTLTLFGSYDVFDFYREWVAFNLDETTNWREVDLADFRWMIQGITVEYLSGTASVTLQLQAETGAPAGTTYIPPAPDPSTIPDYTPDIPYFPPIPSQQGYTAVTNNIVCITATARLVRTTNFTSGSPTWSTVDLSASITTTVICMCVDPTSPCYLGTGSELRMWVMDLNGIYLIEDAESGSPTVTSKYGFQQQLDDIHQGCMDISYANDAGRYGFAVYWNNLDNEQWFAVMTNGSTWAGDRMTSAAIDVQRTGCTIDPHIGGMTYAWGRSDDHFPDNTIYSGTYGVAEDYVWMANQDAGLSDGFGQYPASMYIPFAATRHMWFIQTGLGDGHILTLADLVAKTTDEITMDPSGGNDSPRNRARCVISSPSGDVNQLMVACNNQDNRENIWHSTNALLGSSATWTEIGGNIAPWVGCAMVDPDGAGAYLWAIGAIYFWTGGTTIVSKNGTGFTAAEVVNIAGF